MLQLYEVVHVNVAVAPASFDYITAIVSHIVAFYTSALLAGQLSGLLGKSFELETVGVGPELFEQFIFPYQLSIVERFGPLLLEDLLARHPRLRVQVMHAGYPMIGNMLTLLQASSHVYVDVAGLIWSYPLKEVNRYIERLVDAMGETDRDVLLGERMSDATEPTQATDFPTHFDFASAEPAGHSRPAYTSSVFSRKTTMSTFSGARTGAGTPR